MSGKGRKKSSTRTIRIAAEQESALTREAERRGLSVNALIGQIFDRYLTGYRYYDVAGMIVFSSETVSQFLVELDNATIKSISYTAGKARIQSGLLQRGRRMNFDNIAWYITQVLGETHGWFRCDLNMEESTATFHLTHKLGYKWSVFIEAYLTSVFMDSLNLSCNSVIMNNAVNIEVRR
jgi:hypothetical protein